MIKPRLPLDRQMAGESCKLTAQEIAASGDIGDLVSPPQDSFALFEVSLLFCLVPHRFRPVFRLWQNRGQSSGLLRLKEGFHQHASWI